MGSRAFGVSAARPRPWAHVRDGAFVRATLREWRSGGSDAGVPRSTRNAAEAGVFDWEPDHPADAARAIEAAQVAAASASPVALAEYVSGLEYQGMFGRRQAWHAERARPFWGVRGWMSVRVKGWVDGGMLDSRAATWLRIARAAERIPDPTVADGMRRAAFTRAVELGATAWALGPEDHDHTLRGMPMIFPGLLKESSRAHWETAGELVGVAVAASDRAAAHAEACRGRKRATSLRWSAREAAAAAGELFEPTLVEALLAGADTDSGETFVARETLDALLLRARFLASTVAIDERVPTEVLYERTDELRGAARAALSLIRAVLSAEARRATGCDGDEDRA